VAGVAPLALLLDLVRLTGGVPPVDARLRALASHSGISRLRTLGWPPPARVSLAGMLVADLAPVPDFAAPGAAPHELRSALVTVLGGAGPISSGPVRELEDRIATARREKESFVDNQDFVAAAARRDTEKQLIARRDALMKEMRDRIPAGPPDLRVLCQPAGDPGWQADQAVFDVVSRAVAEVSALTLGMLLILGPAATAADPALPLKVRGRVSALPRIGDRERRLITDSVTVTMARSAVRAEAAGSASGTQGVSRRGKITGLLPGQLALPEDLLEYRFASRELLYRVNEADAQALPDAVTIVLDTTPATFGPPELVLRLVAHVITVMMWTAAKSPTLISLDLPRLVRQMAAPSDLATLWTARTLEPPDARLGLATARTLGAPVVLLTQHHLVRDLRLIPHHALRVLTTHVADDPPARRFGGQFHVHLPPDPTSAQVVRAVEALIRPTAERRAG
jgi:hypothetical protein